MTREEYAAKLAMANVFDAEMIEEIETNSISDEIYDNIINQLSQIYGRDVFPIFYWNLDKLFGIMNSIVLSKKYRQEALLITHLDNTIINLWAKYAGQIPYISKDGLLNIGKPMDVNKIKKLIPIVASKLNVLVTEGDMADITQEHWDKIYNNALERAKATKSFNAITNNSDENTTNPFYEE